MNRILALQRQSLSDGYHAAGDTDAATCVGGGTLTALRMEDRAFDSASGNWWLRRNPSETDPIEQTAQVDWCYGAAGICISRGRAF